MTADRDHGGFLEGRTAALLEQQRGSVFAQEIGNVPLGAEVEAELTIDQRLDWRDDGSRKWRFPTALAPRYQGVPGRVLDAGRTTMAIADGPLAPRLSLALSVRDGLVPGKRPALARDDLHYCGWPAQRDPRRGERRSARSRPRGPVAGGDARRRPLRRSPSPGRRAARRGPRLRAPDDRPSRTGAEGEPVARDLIVLLDTSGSMSGEPLEQARKVVGTLVDSLGREDRLELVAFSSAVHRRRRGAAEATEASRKDARRWLAKLSAEGGTEMRKGIREALRSLRAGAQRQVVLVTDGLIGFEQEVVAEILAGDAASRVSPAAT